LDEVERLVAAHRLLGSNEKKEERRKKKEERRKKKGARKHQLPSFIKKSNY
jgi:hypothetical protein